MPPALLWVSFVLASIGALLGIINGFRQYVSGNVRLRIKCYPLTILQPADRIETSVCVEIANAGSFPVTIKEVTFDNITNPKGRRIDHRKRDIKGNRLPIRVESHDAIQIIFPDFEFMVDNVIKTSNRVIVDTACGHSRYCSLREWHRVGNEYERRFQSGAAPSTDSA
jgi:hypothetical protein